MGEYSLAADAFAVALAAQVATDSHFATLRCNIAAIDGLCFTSVSELCSESERSSTHMGILWVHQ